jgi:sulfhydrogenase subunit alpha
MKVNKSIQIPHLGRVEGHGGIDIEIENGEVVKVNLDIYEGSRFYEILVMGKNYYEVPSIISRVCAICSVGHTLTSQMAVENAFGLKVTKRTELLRGLLLHGQLIESHSLHIAALVLPDLLGYDGVLSMAKDYAKEVSVGLGLKKLGNAIQELVGGRCIHPINALVGGFGKVPEKNQLLTLKGQLEKGLGDALVVADLLGTINISDYADSPTIFAALEPHDTTRYSYLGDTIITSLGERFPVAEFRKICHEGVVKHSHAKQSLYSGKPFMTGSLARINLNGAALLAGKAKEVQEKLIPNLPSQNILHNNLAQMIEMVHSIERAMTLIDLLIEERLGDQEPLKFEVHAGKGVGAIEVPRGTLYHYYEIDDEGKIIDADIITPTAQNLANCEKDLKVSVGRLMNEPKDYMEFKLEMVARAYDPCISCAVHLVNLEKK